MKLQTVLFPIFILMIVAGLPNDVFFVWSEMLFKYKRLVNSPMHHLNVIHVTIDTCLHKFGVVTS